MVRRGAICVLAGAVICAVVVGGCSTGVDKSGGEERVEPLTWRVAGIVTQSMDRPMRSKPYGPGPPTSRSYR